MYRWLLPLLLCGCGIHQQADWQTLHGEAESARRSRELDGALAQTEQALARLHPDRDASWYWEFALLRAEIWIDQGKAKQAIEWLDNVPAGNLPGALQARWRMHQGWARYRLDDPDAGRWLQEADQLLAPDDASPLAAKIASRLGILATRDRDFEAAQRHFQRVLRISRVESDRYVEASTLSSLGNLAMERDRYDEAVTLYEQSLVVAEGLGRAASGIVSGNLGWSYYRLGNIEKALQHLERALAAHRGKDLRREQTWVGMIGNCHYQEGELRKAQEDYQHALELAEEIQSLSGRASWHNNLATVAIELGDLETAEDHNRQALELQAVLDNPRSRLWPRLNAARIAAARSRPTEAESLYQEVIASDSKGPSQHLYATAGLGQLALLTGQAARADVLLSQTIEIIEEKRTELIREESRISYLARLMEFYRDYVDFLMERGEVEQALVVAESSRARVLSEKLEQRFGTRVEVDPLILKRIAGRREAVLLSYWLAPKRSFLWVITPERIRAFTLPGERVITSTVESYRRFLDQHRDPLESDHPAGRRLYEMLIAPAAPLLARGSRVIVAPDRALHGINLETLPVPGERPHYWIEDVTLAVAPSLTTLGLTAPGRPESPGSLLLIGDPESADPLFPRLAHAAEEIETIRRQFAGYRQHVVTGTDATPQVYHDSNPGTYSVIHFAAHATADYGSPMLSSVVLSPGNGTNRLFAQEIGRNRLQADLVTISACRSAGARAYSGEGLVGFAWAFLHAGAQNVVAGLWDVADSSTTLLMQGLYRELSGGASAAVALRQAKLDLVHSSQAFRKPYYWGPFQLYVGQARPKVGPRP